jgi:NitT/TauT family transport system substrate-binding protein
MPKTHTRRRFLATLSLTGAAGLHGASPSLAHEETLETTSVRPSKTPSICVAPQYIADELLRAEGFTDVRYVNLGQSTPRPQAIAHGMVDFSGNFVAPLIVAVASGEPITFLAGMHVGCFELFGNDSIRSIADLIGKSVGVPALGSNQHIFLTAMVAHVGFDPNSDIDWVTSAAIKPVEAFEQGTIDAFLGFPPEPQELRARNVKHVVVNSALDQPWSQHFCCTLVGNREYVRSHLAATKRVVRALLKAADLCADQPEASARLIADRGFTRSYDYALEALRENPYGQWRDYDVEDSVRFYALRLHELGMIKHNPKRILAAGTDFRFLDEVKRELKG